MFLTGRQFVEDFEEWWKALPIRRLFCPIHIIYCFSCQDAFSLHVKFGRENITRQKRTPFLFKLHSFRV